MFNKTHTDKNFYEGFKEIPVDQAYLDGLYKIAMEEMEAKGNGEEITERKEKGTNIPTKKKNWKRSEFSKFTRIAAVCVLCLLAVTAATLYLNPQAASGVRDLFAKHTVETEDGKLVTGADNGTGEEVSEKTLTLTNWEDVAGEKEKFPQLGIPNYVPAGYDFESLDINIQADGVYTVEYLFKNENLQELLIRQNGMPELGEDAFAVSNYDKVIEIENRKIYLSKASVENKLAATYKVGDNKISITGKLEERELGDIIRNFII